MCFGLNSSYIPNTASPCPQITSNEIIGSMPSAYSEATLTEISHGIHIYYEGAVENIVHYIIQCPLQDSRNLYLVSVPGIVVLLLSSLFLDTRQEQ